MNARKGAPDLDAAELLADAIRTYSRQQSLGRHPLFPSGPVKDGPDFADHLAEEIQGHLHSHGAAINLPQIFAPKPVGMTFTAYGVSLSELGEDGDEIIVLGHVSRRRLLAALNRYWRTFVGLNRPDITELLRDGSMKHTWAEFLEPANTEAIEWAFLCYPAAAPDSAVLASNEPTPITRWSA
ncbi:hypothetical protein CH275_04990 [Rhodococcus sp. 06-235-1A]|uniref:hypothetical protein n=1 Tax=Rhodococcus sp. 06-235-1A TaxID=2022508 RepID=UPI000B9A2117|nr:hypothetical protein [Rhodococcus sp. 06-235-1A]OZD08506.1 hypothetical protein CH275_04990 [Rhodococcus sp. 06-235-1A]